MKIRKDKVEVKVKEETVKVAEITADELVDVISRANAKLLAESVRRVAKQTNTPIKELTGTASLVTAYVADLTHKIIDTIFNNEEEEDK